MNCFSGTATSVFKAPHYIILSLSKKNEIKTAFPVQTIVIGIGHAVRHWHCGPLRLMSDCLFPPPFRVLMSGVFHCFLLVIKPKKFLCISYETKSNVQMFSYQVFWHDLNNIWGNNRTSTSFKKISFRVLKKSSRIKFYGMTWIILEEITLQAHLLKKISFRVLKKSSRICILLE